MVVRQGKCWWETFDLQKGIQISPYKNKVLSVALTCADTIGYGAGGAGNLKCAQNIPCQTLFPFKCPPSLSNILNFFHPTTFAFHSRC